MGKGCMRARMGSLPAACNRVHMPLHQHHLQCPAAHLLPGQLRYAAHDPSAKCGHAAERRGGPDLHSSIAYCVMVFFSHFSARAPRRLFQCRVSLIAGTDRLVECVHTYQNTGLQQDHLQDHADRRGALHGADPYPHLFSTLKHRLPTRSPTRSR